MSYKSTYLFISLLFITTVYIACIPTPVSPTVTDSSKSYASFLVLDSANGREILENVKQSSLAEGYEIGPIEYYKLGTRDFDSIIKKLTPGAQVKLIWIVSSLMDVPDIQSSLKKVEYKGLIRYKPATQSVGNKLINP
jgi:hypothetical protein